MRKIVSEENVAAAVEHCNREGLNPSRGRIMGLLAQQEFGGCAGDPARVGAMIRDYLANKEGIEAALSPAAEALNQTLPPKVETVLAKTAQRLSDSMCELADALVAELTSIKTELRENYDHAAEQLRRDADRAIATAVADEQDAMNSLEDALTQKALLEERVDMLQSEHSGALAVASERGEQLLRVEAELERTRTVASAANARLSAERDEARRDMQAAEKSIRNKESLVAVHEKKLAVIQADLDGLRQQAAVSQALADERATRITQLESLLADTLSDIRKPAETPVNTPEVAFSDQSKVIAGIEAVNRPEANHAHFNKSEDNEAKPAKPPVKNPPASLNSVQEIGGVPA